MDDLVEDLMTKKVIAVDEAIMAIEAAKMMAEKGISSLIVEREGVPVGIVTERDFVKKICSRDILPSQVSVGTVMSKLQTYATPDTPVDVAVQRMVNHKIRRLPIIYDKKVVGIITVTDLAKHLRTILLIDKLLKHK